MLCLHLYVVTVAIQEFLQCLNCGLYTQTHPLAKVYTWHELPPNKRNLKFLKAFTLLLLLSHVIILSGRYYFLFLTTILQCSSLGVKIAIIKSLKAKGIHINKSWKYPSNLFLDIICQKLIITFKNLLCIRSKQGTVLTQWWQFS